MYKKKSYTFTNAITLSKSYQPFLCKFYLNHLITIDQINLLKYDNIKTINGITNFDIGCPSKIKFEETVMNYAFNWTEGGQFSNSLKK